MTLDEKALLTQSTQLWKLFRALKWREVTIDSATPEQFTLAFLKESAADRTLHGDTRALQTFWKDMRWISQLGWREERNGFGVVLSITSRLCAYCDPDGAVSIFRTGDMRPWLIFDEEGILCEQRLPPKISQHEAWVLPMIVAGLSGVNQQAYADRLPPTDPHLDDD